MSSIGNTINSINTSLLSGIQSLSGTEAAGKNAKASPNVASSDRVDFSKVGKLFSELEQVQKSDPERLKQVLTDAASKLKESATQETDAKAASFLNDLAGRFEKAADTEDLTALHPEASLGSGGPRGHHGNRHAVQRADHDSDDPASTTNLATTAEPTQPTREERFLPSPEGTTESFLASTREERSQTSIPETAQLLGPPEPAPIENTVGAYLADRYVFHEVRKADNYSDDGVGVTTTSPREERSEVASASTLASILTSSVEGTDSSRIGRLLLQFVSNNSSDAS